MNSSERTCAVLGCTGSVGQRFILLLAEHPHFIIQAVSASSRSAGKKYKDAVTWKHAQNIPKDVAEMTVRECKSQNFDDCDIIFSALDDAAAGEIEMAFLLADKAVFSNAKNHRQNPLVPLVIPTINVSHMGIVPHQREHYGITKGLLICNSNCATTGIAVPLAAIHNAYPKVYTEVSVVTMQAVSGAGYPGVSSIDMIDNVVPYIRGEEEKIEMEARKILGSMNRDNTSFVGQAKTKISASCNRVPVLDGHMACISIRFPREYSPDAAAVLECFLSYKPEIHELDCASLPTKAIVVRTEDDRPQPRLDRDVENGFAVVIGRVREDPSKLYDVQFVTLSHNTILGAAGSSILNAEVAVQTGLC